jgi:hypothetical protein
MIAAELEDVVGVAAAREFWSADSFIGGVSQLIVLSGGFSHHHPPPNIATLSQTESIAQHVREQELVRMHRHACKNAVSSQLFLVLVPSLS